MRRRVIPYIERQLGRNVRSTIWRAALIAADEAEVARRDWSIQNGPKPSSSMRPHFARSRAPCNAEPFINGCKLAELVISISN